MKRTQMLRGVGLILFFSLALPVSGKSATLTSPAPALQPGDSFPRISFPNLFTPEDKKYLVVGEKKSVSIDDIRTDVLVIYVLNTNCPICLKSLPVLEEVFETTKEDPRLAKRIKMIAIGAGDTPTEIEAFKQGNGIHYPIVPDGDYKVHKALHEPAVPFIVVTNRDQKRKWIVAAIHSGVTFSAESFISELKALLETNPGR